MSVRLSHPTKEVSAALTLPVSKSICNRALVLQRLGGGGVMPLSDCDDTKALMGGLAAKEGMIDIGAAGTAMRFLTAYWATREGEEHVLTGSERMKRRPIAPLVEALREVGAEIDYEGEEGYPPLRIKGGKLRGGEVKIKGDVSSQFVSALMMVAPTMDEGLRIRLIPPVVSVPYIEMTREMMRSWGVEVTMEGNVVTVPHGEYRAIDYKVEGDWSAASYWYEALALAESGEVTIEGLREDSIQGDRRVADLFTMLGVETTYTAEGIRLRKVEGVVNVIDYDLAGCPDLVQTMVVTCCLKGVMFNFSGIGNLRIKETDRIAALEREMRKLGYRLTTKEDAIAWKGERVEAMALPVIDTYDDHRMAMAFAPVALKQMVVIENEGVVSKSYPAFWEELQKGGFVVE